MEAIGLARVSTSKQGVEGASLALQSRDITSACAAKGWHLKYIAHDVESTSQSMRYRPKLQAHLSKLWSGQADVLVVARSNRLIRSVPEGRIFADKMLRRGKVLYFCDWPSINFTDRKQVIMWGMLLSLDELKLVEVSETTSNALRYKRDVEGMKLGPPRTITAKQLDKIMELSEIMTYRKVAEHLNKYAVYAKSSGMPWTVSTVSSAYSCELKRRAARQNPSVV